MNPVFNLPRGTKLLAALILAVHVLDAAMAALSGLEIKLALAFRPRQLLLPGGAGAGNALTYLSLLTYMFLHADLVHLAMNLGLLVAFGAGVERRLGGPRMLLLYLLSGLLAPSGSLLLQAWLPSDAAIVGASGAVSGLFGALLRFAFRPRGPRIGQRRGGSPAGGAALAFVLVNVLFGLIGVDGLGEARGIAWEAHLAGALAGWLLFPLLDRPTGQPAGPFG
ncbi:MAG: rhomboid family intramembrane serine protease [Alphaproteobacteria bacterium]|nr:rhomboid family intramembrane serine protease [Alphaproteobacteria bacterium]